jgi:hypothetical protein
VDCDDGDPGVSPGASETCDEVDNNCDGQIDEGCPGPPVPLATCEAVTGSGSPLVAEPYLIAELSHSWEEAWLGSPVVADLDGDGENEILAPRAHRILGWHIDGTVVFTTETDSRVWAPPIVVDLIPANPGLEVVAASGGDIYAWSHTAELLPGFPFRWQNELRGIAAGDIDEDGWLELVAVTTNALEAGSLRDAVIAVDHEGQLVPGFPPNTTGASGCDESCMVYGGFDQNLAIGDVDGDGAADVLISHDNAHLSLHRGDGVAFEAADIFPTALFPGIVFFQDYDDAQRGWGDDAANDNLARFTASAPAIADIDGDGASELVVLAAVESYDGSSRFRGAGLWVVHHDGSRPAHWTEPYYAPHYRAGRFSIGANLVGATNQVSIGDIEASTAGLEMVFAGFDGRIHAVSAAAEPLWEYEYTTEDSVLTGGVLIADLSRDGIPEIVFNSYSADPGGGHLFVLSSTGEQLHKVPLPDRGAMPVPTVADADGNGVLDIVVSLKDGQVGSALLRVYEVPGSAQNCLLWPTGRANSLRNGYVR